MRTERELLFVRDVVDGLEVCMQRCFFCVPTGEWNE